MEEAKSRSIQVAEHGADRRARELYRYYQPGGPTRPLPAWLCSTAEDEPTSSSGSSSTPVRDTSVEGNSNSSASSQPSTAIGPEALVLGLSNNTLTSFAQLAALRLNVERAFICVLDRDQQFMLSEATKSVNLNDNAVHDHQDGIWTGNTTGRKAWKVCQVSL